MPLLEVRFHPAAAAEAEAGRLWYFERNPRAANAFVLELDLAIHRIREAPEQWPTIKKGVRRYVLPTFPFNLVYRVRRNIIEVVAVARQKRKPGYWRVR